MQKFICGIGFVLVIIGIACAESISMLLPVAMIAAGVVFVCVSAGLEEKWTEK